MEINSKAEMYSLQARGLLGNFLRTWAWDDFLRSKVRGGFGVRHRSVVGWPYFKRGFDRRGVIKYVDMLLDERKITEGDVVISEDTSLADNSRSLQGEVCLSDEGRLTLCYSGVLYNSLTCREEMRQPNIVELRGLRAKFLIQRFFDPESYENLQELLSKYPDAAVEFTTFGTSIGEFGWNTVFWEVRNY